MRRGELLGLGWDDVDLGRRLVHVRRALSVVEGVARLEQPKNRAPRSLHVDELAVAALRRRRRIQHLDADAANGSYANPWNLVFTDTGAAHLVPDEVTRSFRELVRRAPVPVQRLHDLRHLHATHMLAAGVVPSTSSASASAPPRSR